MCIKLTEEGKKVLTGVETVVVTGKANGDTIYVGYREIMLKLSVGRTAYKTLNEGDKLFIREGELVYSKVQPAKEQKSNPPAAAFKHRFPQ